MILEPFRSEDDAYPKCLYGSPLDVDSYIVQQRDLAGFELVKIKHSEAILTPEGQLSDEAPHGSQFFSKFTHYDFSETDHNNVNLYHGYIYPPNGPYNHQHFTSLPIPQNPEAFSSSIWVPKCAHSSINQPRFSTPPVIDQNRCFQDNYNSQTFDGRKDQITYYAPHKGMTIHFPRIPKHGEIFFAQRVDNVLFLDIVSRLNPWHGGILKFSGYPRSKVSYRVHVTKDGFLLMRTGDYVLANPDKNITLTRYIPGYDVVLHYTKYPEDGDIFCPQQNDNVISLYIVPTEKAQEYQSLDSTKYRRERDLYRVHEKNGVINLQRMGDDILVFHEENRSATYYLPKKDIALHFNRVPRHGDIFCSQRSDNVVMLDTSPAETPHNLYTFVYPWDRNLYRVHESKGGFLLVKIDDNNMPPSEESYFLVERIQDEEENTTFTCYLNCMDMAFHFTRVPTPGDIFLSHLKNNIMILEPCRSKDDAYPKRLYGSPLDVDCYIVRQRDAGFELVKIKHGEAILTPEYKLRLRLKIKRYIASSPSSDHEDNMCTVCLDAYKKFDRIGILQCGHKYHVSCIMTWLCKKKSCPVCRGAALNGLKTLTTSSTP